MDLVDADHAIVDAHVEPSIDQANAGQEQVVLDRAGNRMYGEPLHWVGLVWLVAAITLSLWASRRAARGLA